MHVAAQGDEVNEVATVRYNGRNSATPSRHRLGLDLALMFAHVPKSVSAWAHKRVLQSLSWSMNRRITALSDPADPYLPDYTIDIRLTPPVCIWQLHTNCRIEPSDIDV